MAKHDYITAVVVHGTELEWTQLRRQKDQYVVVATGRTPAQEESDLTVAVRAQTGIMKGALTVSVPADQTLLRIADLPSTDPEELAGMVELQMDKYSPFPVDQMVVSHEVLSTHNQSTRVLIAAAKQDGLDALGEPFLAAHRQPDRIDVHVLGWLRLILDHDESLKVGRQALLIIDDHGAEFVICQDGAPVIIRALGTQRHANEEEGSTELSEEVSYTLTSLESEWGVAPMQKILVWHRDEVPQLLMDRLTRETGHPAEAHSLDELPPLSEGLARRATQREPSPALSLAPPEWREKRLSRRAQRRLYLLAGAAILVWALGIGIFLLIAQLDRSHMAAVRTSIEQLEGPAEEARQLRGRVESFEQYADRTRSALEILLEISTRLPPGVELSSFTYRKGRTVNLRGESANVTAIYDYIEALEQSPLFIEVKPEGVTQASGGRRNPEFRLTARMPGDAAAGDTAP